MQEAQGLVQLRTLVLAGQLASGKRAGNLVRLLQNKTRFQWTKSSYKVEGSMFGD
jgi:hypothetical protein